MKIFFTALIIFLCVTLHLYLHFKEVYLLKKELKSYKSRLEICEDKRIDSYRPEITDFTNAK